MRAWHFLRDDGTCQYGDLGKIKVGKTYRAKGKLKLCENGMHASTRLIDALRYAPGSLLCRVELSGEILRGDDKVCAEARTVLWMMDTTKILHAFACNEAERAILAQTKRDRRSMEAIRVKRLWLQGKATNEELEAARAAAWAAEWAAAKAAAKEAEWSAAKAAAWAAEWAAAKAAAWAAEWAAAELAARVAAWAAEWSAAKAAARAAQNRRLTDMVMRAHRKFLVGESK